jgi:hypothetical protein
LLLALINYKSKVAPQQSRSRFTRQEISKKRKENPKKKKEKRRKKQRKEKKTP